MAEGIPLTIIKGKVTEAKTEPDFTLAESFGVTEAHRFLLQEYCDKWKVSLILRISDPTSLRLVATNKFACKSVDVHDKSSNWGPQQGSVPVDLFFNKKFGPLHTNADPNVETTRKKEIDHATGDDAKYKEGDKYKTGVKPVQLFVPTSILELYKVPQGGAKTPTLEDCKSDEEKKACTTASGTIGMGCYKALFPKPLPEAAAAQSAAKNMLFCATFKKGTTTEGAVDFTYLTDKTDKTAKPLLVWGYEKNKVLAPVTGDYDLWAIYPHKDSPLLAIGAAQAKVDKAKAAAGVGRFWVGGRIGGQAEASLLLTKRANNKASSSEALMHAISLKLVPVRGGESTVTGLINDMINGDNDEVNLNKVLQTGDGKEVFHHGPENMVRKERPPPPPRAYSSAPSHDEGALVSPPRLHVHSHPPLHPTNTRPPPSDHRSELPPQGGCKATVAGC